MKASAVGKGKERKGKATRLGVCHALELIRGSKRAPSPPSRGRVVLIRKQRKVADLAPKESSAALRNRTLPLYRYIAGVCHLIGNRSSNQVRIPIGLICYSVPVSQAGCICTYTHVSTPLFLEAPHHGEYSYRMILSPYASHKHFVCKLHAKILKVSACSQANEYTGLQDISAEQRTSSVSTWSNIWSSAIYSL